MKHFTLNEFLVSGTAKRLGVDMTPSAAVRGKIEDLVFNILDPLREMAGKAIFVSSGYRPIAVNRAIGSSDTSQHVYGEAADIQVSGMKPIDVCKLVIAMGLPFDQLIQEYGEWVHVSFGPRNRRQILTASYNSQGKTVYTPGL